MNPPRKFSIIIVLLVEYVQIFPAHLRLESRAHFMFSFELCYRDRGNELVIGRGELARNDRRNILYPKEAKNVTTQVYMYLSMTTRIRIMNEALNDTNLEHYAFSIEGTIEDPHIVHYGVASAEFFE